MKGKYCSEFVTNAHAQTKGLKNCKYQNFMTYSTTAL